jgi:hypothetical protein
MSFIVKLLNWAVGNGYDLGEDEGVAKQHHEKTKGCIETSQTHFSIMKKKFEDVQVKHSGDTI